MSSTAQVCLPGMERPAIAWQPVPATLEKIKNYFRGYVANDRPIFATRKYIAGQLGIAVRTLSRYLAFLKLERWIRTVKRTPRSAFREVSDPARRKYAGTSAGTSQRRLRAKEVEVKTEVQHHPDDAESVAEQARKWAGFQRLSDGDRRYLAELARLGITSAAIRAGIIVARARKAGRGRFYSLRYCAETIAEATQGKFPTRYVEYLEHRIPVYELRKPYPHESGASCSCHHCARFAPSEAA